MSKLFYDHLIIFEEVEVKLGKLELEQEEKRELEGLIEEILHHRIMGKVLERLPRKHHEEFLTRFAKTPHDPQLIHYLDEKIQDSIEKHIEREIEKVKKEILEDLRKEQKEKRK